MHEAAENAASLVAAVLQKSLSSRRAQAAAKPARRKKAA